MPWAATRSRGGSRPSAQWGYQYGGARGGGGLSPRGARRRSPPRCRTGCLIREHRGAARRRHPVVAVLDAPRRGRDLVEHDTVRPTPPRGDTSVTPEHASAAEDAYIAA